MEEYKDPSTYEEWVAIHGEPEYLYENQEKTDDRLSIAYRKAEGVKVERDYSQAIYPSSRGLQINYPKFVEVFAENKECVYCNGTFYTPEGMLSNASVRQEIALTLKEKGWSTKIDTPTTSLFNSLKDLYSVDKLPVDENIVPFANGNLHLDKRWFFVENEKLQTPYRLAVPFVEEDKPMPLFTKWLNDVFVQDDIITIQEILGYCLVPVTSAQEAFFIVGDGGVGKSVLGIIIESIFGNAQRVMTTQELVSQRFQLATAENKLVMYDDDLGEGALTETAILKKLITADQKIPAERKYGDPYEFQPYCKIVACANFMLSSMYDDSDGFFRRLHPILVKEKNPNRRTIRDFGRLIVREEREQIARWALKGLKRVIDNGWEIHWSQRSKDYISAHKNNSSHFEEFFTNCMQVDDKENITSMEIQTVYSRWCRCNGLNPAPQKLLKWLSDNVDRLGITYSRSIKRNDRYYRGFSNLKINPVWVQ